MYGPIRCFNCGKVLGDKWLYWEREIAKIKGKESIINVNSKTIKTTPECKILDHLGLKRYCCRRVMLGHVPIGDKI